MCKSIYSRGNSIYVTIKKDSQIMLIRHGIMASRILCKQDDIISRHASVKIPKRKQENTGRTLLVFFWKKLGTEVKAKSTKSATQSSSIPSEEQAESSKDNKSSKKNTSISSNIHGWKSLLG